MVAVPSGSSMAEATSPARWELFDRILERTLELGLARYDPSDFNFAWPYRQLYQAGPRAARLARILKGPSLFAPVLWRRLLGVDPSVVPTVYSHLGLALLDARRLRSVSDLYDRLIIEWGEAALRQRLPDREYYCWGASYPYLCADMTVRFHEPCMHYTARIGYLFWRMAEEGFGQRWRDAAVSVAHAIVQYFNWSSAEGHALMVSYWATSHDEVINVGAEAAVLLAVVANEVPGARFGDLAHGVLRTMEVEQAGDGSWDYWTAADQSRNPGRQRTVDHHHTAMNLLALRRLMLSPNISSDARERASAALNRGFTYYRENLFTAEGRPLAEVGRSQVADIAGFCEGAILLSELGMDPVWPQVRDSRCPTAHTLLDAGTRLFLDARTGDVASGWFLGRPNQLRSIRWGSGLLLEAIARAHLAEARGLEGSGQPEMPQSHADSRSRRH